MSYIIINNIVGLGIYSVPDQDADLTAAQNGLDVLLSSVAGLAYGNVTAEVDTESGAGATRTLKAIISDVYWNGEVCPDATETFALATAIQTTLLSDPNILTLDAQNITLLVEGGLYPAGQGFIYVTDIDTQDPLEVISNKVYQDTPQDTVLVSCTSSEVDLSLDITSSYPRVTVTTTLGTTTATLTDQTGYYTGTVNVTIAAAGETIRVTAYSPNGATGAVCDVEIAVDLPPTIATLSFTGGYPGAQTELKSGDTFQITGTTDKNCTGVRILGPGTYPDSACILAEIAFVAATSFTVSGTIADQGNVATLRPAYVQAKNAAGAYGAILSTNASGASVDGTNVVNCNNLHPTLTIDTIHYPVTQYALKATESATIDVTTANLDSILYDSPNSQLTITSPTLDQATKTVTRIAGSGDYNDSTNNFRGVATRNANAATTTAQDVVEIAAVAPQITVTEAATRLRSGGNDGTSAQNHTITITSNQNLYTAPSVDPAASGGTFIGAWAGGPKIWTRSLQVHDNDSKGTKTWTNPSATNGAGLSTAAITGDNQYVLGGFVARSLTFAAFLQTTAINVSVTDYSKLQAGIFTATDNAATRHAPQGDTADATDEFTITPVGIPSANPGVLFWNDATAASTNASGTAQITNVEETV